MNAPRIDVTKLTIQDCREIYEYAWANLRMNMETFYVEADDDDGEFESALKCFQWFRDAALESDLSVFMTNSEYLNELSDEDRALRVKRVTYAFTQVFTDLVKYPPGDSNGDCRYHIWEGFSTLCEIRWSADDTYTKALYKMMGWGPWYAPGDPGYGGSPTGYIDENGNPAPGPTPQNITSRHKFFKP